ncbi:MAG: hypothetical protein J5848_00560 [Bacteroidales bacterium]|nr:hypothetical protein [Bacteroidales bacterium]
MRRLLLSVFVLSTLLFCACHKEEEKPVEQPVDNNPANAFVGEYDVDVEATLILPIIGEYPLSMPDMDGSIVKVGDDGDVRVTLFGQTQDAYVRNDGMHVDPFIMNQDISGMTLAITVAMPVVKAPVDGVITTTAILSGTTSLGAINGTADIVAVRR